MCLLAQDPGEADNIVTLMTVTDPSSDEYLYKSVMAYYSLVFDHPEMFWLYNESETSFGYGWRENKRSSIYYG